MPFFKCTFFLNGQDEGQSHSFYREAGTHAECIDLCDRLTLALQAFVAKGAKYEAYRISDDAIPGDGLLRPTKPILSTIALSTLDQDVSQAAIYCRLNAGGSYHRPLHLCFFPDDWCKYVGGKPDSLTLYANDQLAQLGRVLASGWKIRAIDKGATNPARDITAIDRGPLVGGQTGYLITVPAHGQLRNIESTIWGAPEIVGLNGQRVVEVITTGGILDADTLKVQTATREDPHPYFRKGKIRFKLAAYPQITLLTFVKFCSRKVSSTFFRPRGRRRVAKK